MITLPREHLLCPFRQRSSWGDTGGDGDVATLKLPGQCPLPSARTQPPTESLMSQKVSSRVRSQMVPAKSQRGRDTRGKAQSEVASFTSISFKIKKKT